MYVLHIPYIVNVDYATINVCVFVEMYVLRISYIINVDYATINICVFVITF